MASGNIQVHRNCPKGRNCANTSILVSEDFQDLCNLAWFIYKISHYSYFRVIVKKCLTMYTKTQKSNVSYFNEVEHSSLII
jgi:hypothetical protein